MVCFNFFVTVWSWGHLIQMVDISLHEWQQHGHIKCCEWHGENMKAAVEHDPLSEKADKRGFRRMQITFPWRGQWELCTMKRKRCSSSSLKSVSILLMSRVRREVVSVIWLTNSNTAVEISQASRPKTYLNSSVSHTVALHLLHKLSGFIPHTNICIWIQNPSHS